MTVARNEPVTLGCKARGSPSPEMEWFRDGRAVRTAPADPTSHRILLPDGSLFFLRAMQSKKEQARPEMHQYNQAILLFSEVRVIVIEVA